MCGIVGIWAPGKDLTRVRSQLEEAVARLRHRGPDDHGIWMNGSGLALGHTRLSILDLSSHGHQPMVSEDGRFVVVFNGEIYNFAEVRAQLTSAGHSFFGTGDTEVILHAFREWGSTAVERFIGMFAIAIWDQDQQTLELFRDRVGVKPLHFSWHGGTLCFASELKALRAFGHWSPEIDRQSLGEFLQYGYISEDRTIYRGVHKLRPGHYLRLRCGQEPVVQPYWSVLGALAAPMTAQDDEIEAELEELLIDACRYRMVSDVPVGVFLSGGVDSSLITAILAKHHNQPIRTFTIGFRESGHDESIWAKRVADHCGTVHKEYILEQRQALDIVRDWGGLFDEPFGDSSGIPTLLVSKRAAEDVKVVLSADGGDELFSGYLSYASVLDRLEKLASIPAWTRRGIARGLSLVSSHGLDDILSSLGASARIRGMLVRKTRRLQAIFGESTAGRLMDVDMSCWWAEDVRRLLGHYSPPRASADSYPGIPAIQISLSDFHHYLPEDILTKVDRTTMAVSIEGREPLLDHRLAEFAFRLPPHLRRGALGSKHILKRILYRYIPRDFVDRPKQGFAIPLESWLRNDLQELTRDYLSDSRIRRAGLMDPKIVSRTVKDFYAGNRYLATPLWFLLAFEMWREQWAGDRVMVRPNVIA